MSKSDDFFYAQWLKRLERWFHILLGLTLLLGINYWAAQRYMRMDMTYNQRYSLSPETLAYLRGLKEPLKIIVTVPRRSNRTATEQTFKDIENLLKEYEHVGQLSGNKNIEVEFVDIFQQRKKVEELVNLYGLQEGNVILIVSGDRQRQLLTMDLYEFKDGGKRAFRGEQVITSAILDVINPERQKIYFTTGHGEMQLDNVDPIKGLSQLELFLRERNFETILLDLNQNAEVPKDTALIVIASPQVALLPQEVEALRKYLTERNGRLIVFLQPQEDPGLDALFYDWGIIAEDKIVIDPEQNTQTPDGDLIVRSFAQNPITQFHFDNEFTALLGPTRPVRPNPEGSSQEELTVVTLMKSSKKSWGERTYKRLKNPTFDPVVDLPGPVSIATASERQIGSQIGLKISGGRLVVFGNSDFIANNQFNSLGNRILIRNTINWCLDRDNILNIPPRKIERFQITLSRQDIWKLGFIILLGLPGAATFIGIVVVWIRNRRA